MHGQLEVRVGLRSGGGSPRRQAATAAFLACATRPAPPWLTISRLPPHHIPERTSRTRRQRSRRGSGPSVVGIQPPVDDFVGEEVKAKRRALAEQCAGEAREEAPRAVRMHDLSRAVDHAAVHAAVRRLQLALDEVQRRQHDRHARATRATSRKDLRRRRLALADTHHLQGALKAAKGGGVHWRGGEQGRHRTAVKRQHALLCNQTLQVLPAAHVQGRALHSHFDGVPRLAGQVANHASDGARDEGPEKPRIDIVGHQGCAVGGVGVGGGGWGGVGWGGGGRGEEGGDVIPLVPHGLHACSNLGRSHTTLGDGRWRQHAHAAMKHPASLPRRWDE
jgi:hypothetical protein